MAAWRLLGNIAEAGGKVDGSIAGLYSPASGCAVI